MKIFLDIETIPLGTEPIFNPSQLLDIKAPANYKDPVKIEAYKKDNFDRIKSEHDASEIARYEHELTEWKKGALKATRSQIVCICAVDEKGNKFKMSTINEWDLLVEFGLWCSGVDSTHYVGHNIESFDIPMIRNHAIKHQCVKLKERFTFKKFSENILDTMILWDKKNWTKLTEIAEFLGIKNLNGDTDGSDIYDLYKAGKFDEIETKCMNDCFMCKEVYERIQ